MMKWEHLPLQAAGWVELKGMIWSALEEASQRRLPGGGDGGIMCGEARSLQCGFTSATSHPTDYYQLFNYSDDIYQGQLYRAVYCGEKRPECFPVALTGGRVCC